MELPEQVSQGWACNPEVVWAGSLGLDVDLSSFRVNSKEAGVQGSVVNGAKNESVPRIV
jgi:hypothetical protein